MMSAMARASGASRCLGWRSVLRRSCPRFDSHELVRSTGHLSPSGNVLGLRRVRPRGRLLEHTTSQDAVAGAGSEHRVAAIAAVEVQGLDVI